MSEQLQFGHHPDADEISAFVEQALPTHEREHVLDHLAACAECREIVALSLPEVEEPAPAIPVHMRKPWWSGWLLAWPLGTALAAAACVVLYIHYASVAPNIPRQQQIADAHPPVSPDIQEKLIPPVGRSDEHGISARPTGSERASSSDRRKKMPETEDGAVLTGRNAAELIKPAPGAPWENSGAGSGASIGRGIGGGGVAAPAPAAEARPQILAPPQPVDTAVAAGQLAAAAAPMSRSSASSVTVASGNQGGMELESAAVGNVELAEIDVPVPHLKRRLPSHLPALSVTAQKGSLVVAIDTHNAVFLSKDAGKHWKPIRGPWQGIAIKTALVEIKPANPSAMVNTQLTQASAAPTDKVMSSQSENGLPALQRRLAETKPAASLSGTVTDPSGAVIPGASVTVTDNATGTAATLKTDASGQFAFASLAPGTYRLDAQSAGFKRQEVAAVSVGSSGPSIANLSLPIGSTSQSVTVTSSQTMTITGADVEIPASVAPAPKPAPTMQPTLVFEIVTGNGERWTSTDGLTWTRM
jgi:hypothetical protein